MEVNFKFDIGEQVWIMENNRPARFEVKNVKVEIESLVEDHKVTYLLMNQGVQREVDEKMVFKTKEELIESL